MYKEYLEVMAKALEQMATHGWEFYFASFVPVVLTGISILLGIFYNCSSKKFQEKISKMEKNYHQRTLVISVYSGFVDTDIFSLCEEGYLYDHRLIPLVLDKISKKQTEIEKLKNILCMSMVNDSSTEAKELKDAVKNACNCYVQVCRDIKIYLASTEFDQTERLAVERANTVVPSAVLDGSYCRNLKYRHEYVSTFLESTEIKEINTKLASLRGSLSDEKFDCYFQKYLTTL